LDSVAFLFREELLHASPAKSLEKIHLCSPVHNASMSCTVGGVYPAASHCVPPVIAGGPGKRAGE